MTGTYCDHPVVAFDQTDTTVADEGLRVKLSGDHGVVLAGVNDDGIGVSFQPGGYAGWATAGDRVSVAMFNKPGTHKMKVAGAITQNAFVYPAASGKISATANGAPIGMALEAASGDGSFIEVFHFAGARFPQDPHKIPDPGTGAAIPVTASGVCNITTAGAETNTLAAPTFDGQRLVLNHDVDGGTRVITVAAAFNETGNNTITLTDVDECCELVAVRKAGALRWQVGWNVGCTLSTV